MIPPVPEHLRKRVTRRGGKNENGMPVFRVERGCDLEAIIAGEKRIKHVGTENRYVLEMWLPCDISQSEWEERFTFYVDGKRVEVNGPYPNNGTYELIRVIEKVHVDRKTKKVLYAEFAPLTSTLCDAIVDVAIQNRNLPSQYKVKAAQERRDKEEKEKDQRMIDKIDDMALAFQGKTFVTVPSMKEIREYGG